MSLLGRIRTSAKSLEVDPTDSEIAAPGVTLTDYLCKCMFLPASQPELGAGGGGPEVLTKCRSCSGKGRGKGEGRGKGRKGLPFPAPVLQQNTSSPAARYSSGHFVE